MRVIPREVVKRKHVASWSREIRQMRHKLKLTSIQKKVLIGTILGDGCLIENVGKKNFRLQIAHCIKQKDYVLWKYQIFEDWVLTSPKFESINNSWKFRTISHPELNKFRHIFYDGKEKIIPENIEELIVDPLSLAVWFMDDGALGPNGTGVTFNTQSFNFSGNQRLRHCLKRNFGIKTTLHKDKAYWRIYVLPRSVGLLKKTIIDDVLPELRYKIPFTNPVET